MTARRVCDMPHVDMIVIDNDTTRYGGSFFRRERTCRNKYRDHDDRSFLCSGCGYEAWTYDDSCCDPDEFEFCPNCGARCIDNGGSKDGD